MHDTDTNEHYRTADCICKEFDDHRSMHKHRSDCTGAGYFSWRGSYATETTFSVLKNALEVNAHCAHQTAAAKTN